MDMTVAELARLVREDFDDLSAFMGGVTATALTAEDAMAFVFMMGGGC